MLLLIVFSLILSVISDPNVPPFCDKCACVNDDSNQFVVTCTKDVSSFMFDKASWIDAADNKPYSYSKVWIQNSPILTLKEQFPVSNLIELSLANNSIVSISSDVFSNLQNMQMLDLSYNNIEILHPDAFNGQYLEGDWNPLRSLVKLYLAHNRIHSLDKDIFEHADRIELLSLSHNPLKILDQSTAIAITSLVYLKNLDLSYTGLSSLPAAFLHTPKKLIFLDLSGNQFTGIPDTLGDAHSLETLYFNNNPMVNLTNKNGFPVISTLKYLHLSSMPNLVNISKESLSNLVNLTEFYCFNNPKLSYIDRDAFSSRRDGAEYKTWPPIKKLFLQNNKLASMDMEVVLNWKDLVALDLTENAWTCECENQWMIDELMPIYLQLDENKAKALKCEAPIEMASLTFYDVYQKQTTMRCLDLYGHRPERDGVLLVGILAGVLITIPLVLFIIYAYQRHWFGLFDNSPAGFSRQFYKRSVSTSEDAYL
ncbi:leucine-rich repeat neuronal protein 1 [Tribolium castaneum]|uniref:Leucine-rich repeat neuronal protein 1-like Protein n=1 Tax=Tribolium castaneum TaxID=7070 RepID=D2A4M8_TRICA|nr:PREDICTED: leucine-rich repeat neuronal protein 1 [Tribolium castaneum]EFA05244.1 Leucine-rich repeat neuronal protein 1-like Protein [Tribolium castaneum]|eukprot:XP_966598.1 PREDICTED: leucine-rich repeat neuronal protein 1 [Tribolium castaneum]